MNESDSQKYWHWTRIAAIVGVAALVVAACGGDDADGAGNDRPTVVVTTSILGDVVARSLGDGVDVVTVMPPGVEPHEFQASAREANQIREADVLVVNGGGFEEGLLDVIDAAVGDGVPVFDMLSAVDGIEQHDDHDHEVDDHEGVDPHFFTDPTLMETAVEAMVQFAAAELDVDAGTLTDAGADYVQELEALDAEMVAILSEIPDSQRVLVTNHEVFGYFADRYDFRVVGAVIPTGSTADGASAGDLAALADLVRSERVRAVFADTSSSDDLIHTLADEAGSVEVVALYSESLGPDDSEGSTYVDMMRTNAQRIAAALG